MESVLLLSFEYQPISLITVKKAAKLICKGRVDVVKSTDKKLHKDMFIPKAVRLLKSIAYLYKREIPWNKGNTFIRDNYTCAYCGEKLSARQCTVDHVIPVSKGGKNGWLNTVTACKACNNVKGNKYLEQVNMKLRYHPFIPSLFSFIQAKIKGLDYSGIWE